MKITKRHLRRIIKETILNEAGKGIMDIVKRYKGKRLKKSHRLEPTRYEFSDNRTASQVTWMIHDATGREAVGEGNIVTVYR
jgi:hypothetical protein